MEQGSGFTSLFFESTLYTQSPDVNYIARIYFSQTYCVAKELGKCPPPTPPFHFSKNQSDAPGCGPWDKKLQGAP